VERSGKKRTCGGGGGGDGNGGGGGGTIPRGPWSSTLRTHDTLRYILGHFL